MGWTDTHAVSRQNNLRHTKKQGLFDILCRKYWRIPTSEFFSLEFSWFKSGWSTFFEKPRLGPQQRRDSGRPREHGPAGAAPGQRRCDGLQPPAVLPPRDRAGAG